MIETALDGNDVRAAAAVLKAAGLHGHTAPSAPTDPRDLEIGDLQHPQPLQRNTEMAADPARDVNNRGFGEIVRPCATRDRLDVLDGSRKLWSLVR